MCHLVTPLAWGMPMGPEWIVIAALGLLIFGKRLPEVGKGIGLAIKGLKEGLNGEGAAEDAPGEETRAVAKLPEVSESRPAAGSGYKFDPYTGKPL